MIARKLVSGEGAVSSEASLIERLMEGATKVRTSEFATCMIENMAAAVVVG